MGPTIPASPYATDPLNSLKTTIADLNCIGNPNA